MNKITQWTIKLWQGDWEWSVVVTDMPTPLEALKEAVVRLGLSPEEALRITGYEIKPG
jgi:hypothetical protein